MVRSCTASWQGRYCTVVYDIGYGTVLYNVVRCCTARHGTVGSGARLRWYVFFQCDLCVMHPERGSTAVTGIWQVRYFITNLSRTSASREFDEFQVNTHICKLRCWYS